jgi:hypothetical protein
VRLPGMDGATAVARLASLDLLRALN